MLKCCFKTKDNSPDFFAQTDFQVTTMGPKHQGLIRLLCATAGLLFVSAAVAAQDKRLEFTLEQAPWKMTLPAGDFKLAQKKMKPDGSGAYYYLTDETTGLNLSMYIEPAVECKD